MNKKYLKENNLYEAHKQFMRLCEWSYVPSSLQEDEEEDPNEAPPMDDPNGGDDMGMGDPNGGMPPMDDPSSNGMSDNSSDGMNMNDPNAAPPMDDPNSGDDMGMGDPNGGMPPMDEQPIDDMPEDNDTVIDVDDITNAQEKVNDRVNTVGKNLGKVDDKIENLMQSLESMLTKIDAQNQEIETLKNEFSKRNPSPTEKLNMRSLDSYPFNVRPDDYWSKKGETSNYQAYSDNEEPTDKEYKITNNDVDDFDEKTMADSFFVDDDMQQDLEKIFKGF